MYVKIWITFLNAVRLDPRQSAAAMFAVLVHQRVRREAGWR